MAKIIVVILVIVALGSIYFWQNSQVVSKAEQNYINGEWNFSLKLPEGYRVSGEDTLLYVVSKPTPENETPTPEMRIKLEQGSQTSIDKTDSLVIVSQEEISINNTVGHKISVSYKDYPEDSQCPIYRLHNNGVVYEFSLYECLESEIFESVVQSFNII